MFWVFKFRFVVDILVFLTCQFFVLFFEKFGNFFSYILVTMCVIVFRSRLSDLRGVTPCPETRTSLLFIDTAGCGFYETSQGNETCDESYANFDETFIVEQGRVL
jgi:hypothetical protein